MEISELTLLVARFGVLALMYLFVLALVFALRADARAANAPPAPQPAAKPQAQAQTLQVTGGTLPTTGREYTLFGPLEIGRSVSCNISIPNNFVSTHHARLFSQNGRWMVEDLGSTNGTFVNGKPVTTAHPVQPGDQLVIGDTEFIIG